MNHAATLRLSLLVSLGIVPVACGGVSRQGNEAGSGGRGSGTGQSGAGPAPTAAGGTSAGPIVGTGGTSKQDCTSPKMDRVTGLVACAEGYQHRPVAVTCEVFATAGGAGPGGEGGAGGAYPELPRSTGDVECESDADCRAFELGYCEAYGPFSACSSGCRVDADCGTNEVCICEAGSSPGGVCRSASCKTDADCGNGSLCATYEEVCDEGGFACQSLADECASSADCPDQATCAMDSHRFCEEAVCGRPFLVEAKARVAPVVAGQDWSTLGDAQPRVDHLTNPERTRLAQHWTSMGQLEHASIAAFARFSLQLLSLGAPPELVEACTHALSDETAHARLCFRIASAYAGHAVGPGPLDVSDSLLATSLVEIVELVIAEGCFGETDAALAALEAAGLASDPVIVAAYERIAADEQRHAELAFRFVRWALAQARPQVAERIARAIEAPPTRAPAALSVSLPCLQALLAA